MDVKTFNGEAVATPKHIVYHLICTSRHDPPNVCDAIMVVHGRRGKTVQDLPKAAKSQLKIFPCVFELSLGRIGTG